MGVIRISLESVGEDSRDVAGSLFKFLFETFCLFLFFNESRNGVTEERKPVLRFCLFFRGNDFEDCVCVSELMEYVTKESTSTSDFESRSNYSFRVQNCIINLSRSYCRDRRTKRTVLSYFVSVIIISFVDERKVNLRYRSEPI